MLERILRVNQIIIRGQFRLLTHHTLRTTPHHTSHHLSTYFSTQSTLIFIQLQARLISQPQLMIALSIVEAQLPMRFRENCPSCNEFPQQRTFLEQQRLEQLLLLLISTIKAEEKPFSHISTVYNMKTIVPWLVSSVKISQRLT